MSKYLQFIQLLIALGTKLPAVWPKVLQLIELVKSIANDLGFGPAEQEPGTLGVEDVPADVLAAENQLSQSLTAEGTQSAFDGSRLRALWRWLQETGLDDLLISLLRGLLVPA